MPGWLLCPDNQCHRDLAPEALVKAPGHDLDPTLGAAVALGILTEGSCPACPQQQLHRE
jgi:hypothetical protein